MNEIDKKNLILNLAMGMKTHDVSLLESLLTEDVVWSLPGKSLMSGEAQGVAGILKRAEILQQYEVNVGLEHIVYGHQGVGLLLHNTGKHGGKTLDEHLTTVCLLRGDKIARLDTYISDVDMLNAYFA